MTTSRSTAVSEEKHTGTSLSATPPYAVSASVEARCTLRLMNRDYIASKGYYKDNASFEELSKCVAKDCYAPLQ
jgi:hypothetical protein